MLSRSAGQALQGTLASGSTSSGSPSCYSLQPLDLDFPKCPPIPPNCAVSKTLSSPDSEILLAGQLKRSELCSESIIPTGGQGGQTTQVVFTDCEALMTDASTKAQYFSNCCLATLRRIWAPHRNSVFIPKSWPNMHFKFWSHGNNGAHVFLHQTLRSSKWDG